MAKRAATFRLDEVSLEWVADYARKREVSQAAVMELAIAALRGDASGGVPDLTPDGEVIEPQRPRAVSGVVRASSLVADAAPSQAASFAMAHQRRLNEAAERARKARK